MRACQWSPHTSPAVHRTLCTPKMHTDVSTHLRPLFAPFARGVSLRARSTTQERAAKRTARTDLGRVVGHTQCQGHGGPYVSAVA